MFSSKRVTFEDRPNKTCTNLESAKRRNAELIKVCHSGTAHNEILYDFDLKLFRIQGAGNIESQIAIPSHIQSPRTSAQESYRKLCNQFGITSINNPKKIWSHVCLKYA